LPEGLVKLIADDFDLKAVVATEIEFYLHDVAAKLSPEQIILLIETTCAEAGIMLACAEAERGPDQYEVSLLPSQDVMRLVEDTERFKTVITDAFAKHDVRVDFAAKPLKEAPGNGLHIHVHLEGSSGRNVYFREGETFSPMLLHSVGGLLALMNPCMSIFAPRPESYDRFLFAANDYLICPTAINIPLTVSWGTNNRTVAIRLPQKAMDNKHIEHRVSCSDADIASVISAILAGVHYGLSSKCNPGEPIYGDASLPQYALPPLARSLEEARKHRQESAELKGYYSLIYA